MQQQTQDQTGLELIIPGVDLPGLIPSISEVYKTITGKADRACIALSQVQTIQDDATDALANNLLVKTRVTFEQIQELRMGVTSPLDALKAKMMEAEKRIDTDSKATGSEFNRVKALRNKYAQEKADKQRQEQQRIETERRRGNEVARVKAAIQKNIVDGVYNAINKMGDSVRAYVNEMTLENWESKLGKFNVKPKLAQAVYDAFFQVSYDATLVTVDIYQAICEEVKKEESYEKINGIYIQQGEGVIKMWKEDLPNIKQKLEDLAALAEKDALAAATQRRRDAEEQQRKADEQKAALAKQQEAQQAELPRKENEEKLKNEFEGTVQLQGMEELKNVNRKRVAVISCADVDIVKTLSMVLYACYSNPKFKGHLKRDKQGKPLPPDENGVPQYADWVKPLLAFVEKEFDGQIEGITFKEVISTIQKAEKKSGE